MWFENINNFEGDISLSAGMPSEHEFCSGDPLLQLSLVCMMNSFICINWL